MCAITRLRETEAIEARVYTPYVRHVVYLTVQYVDCCFCRTVQFFQLRQRVLCEMYEFMMHDCGAIPKVCTRVTACIDRKVCFI